MLAAMIELRVSIRHHAFLKDGLNINRCGTVFRTISTFLGSERNEAQSRKKPRNSQGTKTEPGGYVVVWFCQVAVVEWFLLRFRFAAVHNLSFI
jgi:hypothetical protein